MPGMLSFLGNIGGELQDSKFPTSGMPVFHGSSMGNLGRELKHSKFLMPRMQLFQSFGGNLGGELEHSELPMPDCHYFTGIWDRSCRIQIFNAQRVIIP